MSLTLLSGYAVMSVDWRMRYPNATTAVWNSNTRRTTSFSFIVNDTFAFTELFIAVRCSTNVTYTVMASQYSANRLGRFPMRLTNGVPQGDTLAAVRPDEPLWWSPLHYWRYFVYYLPVQDDITFSINKKLGEVEAYIAFDPLLDANSPNYTQFRIPIAEDNDHAMDHHGLNTFPLMAAKPGRYVIGVHARSLADYEVSVTAHFTHQVIVSGRPTVGAIQVYRAAVDDVRDTARYVMYLPYLNPYYANRPDALSITLTMYSGLAHFFVSDITWDIDPRNASSYRWNVTDHPYVLHIPGSQLRQGPYWIHVHALQNATYSLLASHDAASELQLGLPQTTLVEQPGPTTFFTLLPGGRDPRLSSLGHRRPPRGPLHSVRLQRHRLCRAAKPTAAGVPRRLPLQQGADVLHPQRALRRHRPLLLPDRRQLLHPRLLHSQRRALPLLVPRHRHHRRAGAARAAVSVPPPRWRRHLRQPAHPLLLPHPRRQLHRNPHLHPSVDLPARHHRRLAEP